MTAREKQLPAAVGFLTMLEDAEHGVFGGYLVLNALGRPLEFHCTAPVKANRAQEILYGPTLTPYLYGEQIGQTLVNKSKVTPLWVCTDKAPALAARDFVSMPVALVLSEEPVRQARVDAPHAGVPIPHAKALTTISLGPRRLALAAGHLADQKTLESHWPEFGDQFDLLEPFDRIREALSEAQKAR